MLIGYARVSTQDQDNQAQITALQQAGCERIFQEKASGGRWDRLELQRLMEHLRVGDVVVVFKLDRLSRCNRPAKSSCRGESGYGWFETGVYVGGAQAGRQR